MANFDTFFEIIVGTEGGYSNHPADKGGATKYGITEAVARASGYRGDMKELPLDFAKKVYFSQYFLASGADKMPPVIAFNLFDAAVNHGVQTGVKLIQRALGVGADGKVGQRTIAAANSAIPWEFVARFIAARVDFYNDLRTFGTFGRGWTQRAVDNVAYSAAIIDGSI